MKSAKSKTVGMFAAKTHFSELVQEVKRGREIEITERGKPVARLVPVETARRKEAEAAIEELKEFAKRHTLGGLSIKDMINEGRRF